MFSKDYKKNVYFSTSNRHPHPLSVVRVYEHELWVNADREMDERTNIHRLIFWGTAGWIHRNAGAARGVFVCWCFKLSIIGKEQKEKKKAIDTRNPR